MVSAAITRASHAGRLRWFESLDWNCGPRQSRGVLPAAPCTKVLNVQYPTGLDSVANEKAFDAQRGNILAQPDDQCRVWGVNSFARARAFGGPLSEASSRQTGFRVLELAKTQKCPLAGLQRAASDCSVPWQDCSGRRRLPRLREWFPVREIPRLQSKGTPRRRGSCSE